MASASEYGGGWEFMMLSAPNAKNLSLHGFVSIFSVFVKVGKWCDKACGFCLVGSESRNFSELKKLLNGGRRGVCARSGKAKVCRTNGMCRTLKRSPYLHANLNLITISS